MNSPQKPLSVFRPEEEEVEAPLTPEQQMAAIMRDFVDSTFIQENLDLQEKIEDLRQAFQAQAAGFTPYIIATAKEVYETPIDGYRPEVQEEMSRIKRDIEQLIPEVVQQ